jgi:DNA-binding NtrC family response regulator
MKCSDFTILIGEDNPSELKIYNKVLSLEGYQLILVESGAKILNELKDKKVDLLLTDLNMKPMSGLAVVMAVNEKYPVLPVIVVSGYYKGMVDNFNQKTVRVAAFIQKPVGIKVLKQKIREVLKIGVS